MLKTDMDNTNNISDNIHQDLEYQNSNISSTWFSVPGDLDDFIFYDNIDKICSER